MRLAFFFFRTLSLSFSFSLLLFLSPSLSLSLSLPFSKIPHLGANHGLDELGVAGQRRRGPLLEQGERRLRRGVAAAGAAAKGLGGLERRRREQRARLGARGGGVGGHGHEREPALGGEGRGDAHVAGEEEGVAGEEEEVGVDGVRRFFFFFSRW